MTNKNNSTIYIGVTSKLKARVDEHVSKIYPTSFTSRYNCNKLVYYESFEFIEEAIVREKQLKGGSRQTKEKLIKDFNPTWEDLVNEIEE